MVELFANSGDPDQRLHFAASDLGLQCLPITLLGVSRQQCVKGSGIISSGVFSSLLLICNRMVTTEYDIAILKRMPLS